MKIDPKKDPAHRCMKLALWPESDRQAWLTALEPVGFFDLGGVANGWKPTTQRKVCVAYGRWLNWLDRNGLMDPSAGPFSRASPANVANYVRHLQTANAPYTVLGRVRDLHHALKVMEIESDWSWLQRVAKRLRRNVTTIKNKPALMIPSADLFSFGLELMVGADQPSDRSPLKCASLYRDGLMIAMLASRPLRRQNFTSLVIGQHLVQRRDAYWIYIPGAETKTGAPIEVPVPFVLTPYLDRYIHHHRHVLTGHTGNWPRRDLHIGRALWVSDQCTAMRPGTLYQRVMKVTAAKFGRALSPHLFRDCAATSIAIEDPKHVYITTSILGHTTLATSELHYNHAQSLEASARIQEVILGLRKIGRDNQAEASRGLEP
jgi:integrase/recombinase XerD